MQNDELEQRIRERAYLIWIDEGRPEGRDQDHWAKAELELAPGLVPSQTSAPIGEITTAKEQSQARAREPATAENSQKLPRE